MNADATVTPNADSTVTPEATPATWRVGDVIGDLYEVTDEITAGGMGVVYRVHHRGWNVDMAVKTPNAKSVASADRMRNFETEAQTWVELGLHPSIVACVYVRRLDGGESLH